MFRTLFSEKKKREKTLKQFDPLQFAMQKFVLILCGAPGIDKLSAITTQRVASLPETCFMRLNYPENCLFSPFHFFLRHPEAGLGRFCKQVCKHLFECEVAVIQEEQGDIPLLEEIQRSIKKRMSQQEEVMFYKYVVTTLNFALCREGLLKEIGSSLRTLKSTQDKSPKAALSKQIFYQQLAQQIYAESVFVSAWETSENVEEIISLAEENGILILYRILNIPL